MLPTAALLRRHDRPGPRYTSYPTVPHWDDAPAPAVLTDGLAALAPGSRVAVYVHVPFCKEQCLYCGCHMAVSGLQRVGDRYLDALARQIAGLRLPEGLVAERVHLGGGTPTWLTPAQLRRLFALLDDAFVRPDDAVRSVEADPGVTTEAHLDLLAEVGVRRLSLGVQSVDPVVLEAVQRPQSGGRIEALVEGARARGVSSVNLDLMYGLPHQTPARLRATLDRVVSLAPDRLAVFGYAHVPWLKPHQKKLDEGALPDVEARTELLLTAHRALREAGYVAIGFDHFARAGDDLAVASEAGTLHRDFMGYTARPRTPMLGLGPSAISELPDRFVQQEPALGRWWKAVEAGLLPLARAKVLDADDALRKDAILALTCHHRLDLDALGRAHGVDARAHLADAVAALAPLESDGLVEIDDGAITIPELGRLFARNVAMPFDAYLAASAARFSRVV